MGAQDSLSLFLKSQIHYFNSNTASFFKKSSIYRFRKVRRNSLLTFRTKDEGSIGYKQNKNPLVFTFQRIASSTSLYYLAPCFLCVTSCNKAIMPGHLDLSHAIRAASFSFESSFGKFPSVFSRTNVRDAVTPPL